VEVHGGGPHNSGKIEAGYMADRHKLEEHIEEGSRVEGHIEKGHLMEGHLAKGHMVWLG
jgi:hypothetical protein